LLSFSTLTAPTSANVPWYNVHEGNVALFCAPEKFETIFHFYTPHVAKLNSFAIFYFEFFHKKKPTFD
jgi:hypothetical protein